MKSVDCVLDCAHWPLNLIKFVQITARSPDLFLYKPPDHAQDEQHGQQFSFFYGQSLRPGLPSHRKTFNEKSADHRPNDLENRQAQDLWQNSVLFIWVCVVAVCSTILCTKDYFHWTTGTDKVITANLRLHVWRVFLIFPTEVNSQRQKCAMRHIWTQCLQSLSSLTVLKLDINQMSHFESNALLNLTKLTLLNISSNPLANLRNYVVNRSKLLKVLLIDSNFTFDLEVDVFHNVEIKHFITHDCHQCCLSPPGSVCRAKTPWCKSCLFLLAKLAELGVWNKKLG